MTTRDPFGQPDEIAHATPVVSERAARGCVRPDEALEAHARGELELSEFERGEIAQFPEVWFTGLPRGAKPSPRRDAPGEASGDHRPVGRSRMRAWITPAPRAPGDHLAYRYEIERVIGKGSFAKVAQCFDHKRNERVAVKVVRDAPRFHKQVEIEVAALRALRRRARVRRAAGRLRVSRAQVLGVRARLDESPRLAHHPRADSDAFRDAQDPGGGRERRDVPPRRRPAPGRARVSGGEVRDPPRREAGERASALARRVGDRAGGLRQRVAYERAEETRDVRAVAPLPRAGGSAGRRLRRADRRVEPRGASWRSCCTRGRPRSRAGTRRTSWRGSRRSSGRPPSACCAGATRRRDARGRRRSSERGRQKKRPKRSSQERRSFPGRVPRVGVPGSRSMRDALDGCDDGDFVDFVSKCLTWGADERLTPGRALLHPWTGGMGLLSFTRALRIEPPRANASARGASGDFARRRNGTLSRPFSKPPRATSAIRARLSGRTRSSVPSRRSYRWRRRKSRSRR